MLPIPAPLGAIYKPILVAPGAQGQGEGRNAAIDESPPRAPRADAAVDDDRLPGDVASGVRGEERHHVGDVFRQADPSERRVRDVRLEALRVLIHVGPGKRSLDDARTN